MCPPDEVATDEPRLTERSIICRECDTLFLIMIPSDATGEDFVVCPNPGCATMLRLDYPMAVTPYPADAAEPGY